VGNSYFDSIIQVIVGRGSPLSQNDDETANEDESLGDASSRVTNETQDEALFCTPTHGQPSPTLASTPDEDITLVGESSPISDNWTCEDADGPV
jgi:hypothetical protein